MQGYEKYILRQVESRLFPVHTAEEQARAITQTYPRFRTVVCGDRVKAWGAIRPKPMCQDYLVEITYKVKEHPCVDVTHPELKLRAGKTELPHTYGGNMLCLYQPKYDEWQPSMLLADTIVPWTALWLIYYELWLATGEWLGGGEHPDEDPESDTRRDRRRSDRRRSTGSRRPRNEQLQDSEPRRWRHSRGLHRVVSGDD